ncbi:hypothetical protein HYV64_03930 [Candidatus Shapirobacteria bacterium]|nr:hypothetical protein [Candidatus Shapirobacteria bacterium]
MRNRFFQFIFTFYFFLFSFAIPAQAQSTWSGKCLAQGDVATLQGLECLFGNILQVIVGLAGIIFFVMFINGGFQYLFSSGDQKRVATASSTLTMSILGLVGVVSSYLILQLIKKITGADVTNFIIPSH